MQPPNPTLSNLYAYRPPQPTSQLYSHFSPQNPNPSYPPIHYEPHYTTVQIDPNPPGVDSYYSSSSYPVNHAGDVYSDHRAAALTYPHTIRAATPSTYATDPVVYDWSAKEPVLHYDYLNTIYTTAPTVPQDASQQLTPAIPHISWTDLNPTVQPHVAWKKIPKKTKIAQSAWCEVCKLACNSTEVLSTHKLGKKHLKNLTKLTKAASVATTSLAATSATTNINSAMPSNTIIGPVATTFATANVNSSVPSNTIIGPVENPKKGKLGYTKKAETPQDLAKKKRKVLDGGAAANLVRTCHICNVVCNSDTVYRFHIAGQKHASMLKKLQQAAVV